MFTCIECKNNYDDTSGDTDERMCYKCLNEECNHTWEYQPREEDTNIFEHQYCTKCNMIDAGYDENDMGDNSTTSHNFNEGEK